MTSLTPRRLALLLPLCAALASRAQTPTPTATPTPGTPTPTPTPPPNSSFMPASTVRTLVPNGGNYDSANMVVDPDGTLWTASGTENVFAKLSPDGTSITRWTFPLSATPSSFLKNADGTFWLTELGGFNVAKFDPATGLLTEWPDITRRPTALARRPDGAFWLPETGGSLAKFDPVSGTFTYGRAQNAFSLSYPLLEADGTLWACDFVNPGLYKFTADGTAARRWAFPAGSRPSKVIRGPDGALWMSFFGLGQIVRFDEPTNSFAVYQLLFGELPYDLAVYKGYILFSDERNGYVGFLDPASPPTTTATITPTDETMLSTSKAATPTTQTLKAVTDTLTPTDQVAVSGFQIPGLREFPVGIGPAYSLTVDEPRGRILVGTSGGIATVSPPLPITASEIYLPAAASIGGRNGTRWTTEVVTWNRGLTKDTNGNAQTIVYDSRLAPDGVIAGTSPSVLVAIPPNHMGTLLDPIGNEMGGPNTFGALRLLAGVAPEDLFGWGRTYLTREDGGTYGAARNFVKSDQAIGAGQSGFFFAPDDPSTQRTNAGFYVMTKAVGTVSAVDAGGVTRGSISFSWPGGWHAQYSTVFEAMGIAPLPSARIVFSVTSGSILPFGTSIDDTTNDPVELTVFTSGRLAQFDWLPGVARATGALGTTARTDLTLYNPGSVDATIGIGFRPGLPGPVGTSQYFTGTVVVPAGKVLQVADVLASIGVSSGTGTLEMGARANGDTTPLVYAFARVTAAAAGGGRYGYGVPMQNAADAVAPGSRGVFLAVTDNGYDKTQSDLVLTNISDVDANVALVATDVTGAAAGSGTLVVPARATRLVSGVWYAITSRGADFGRIDVVPADGSGLVFAEILRRDHRTGDADPLFPFLMPK